MARYSNSDYDEAEGISAQMQEAASYAEYLMEALQGTELEGWTEDIQTLLEEINTLHDKAEEILAVQAEEIRQEDEWHWYHR